MPDNIATLGFLFDTTGSIDKIQEIITKFDELYTKYNDVNNAFQNMGLGSNSGLQTFFDAINNLATIDTKALDNINAITTGIGKLKGVKADNIKNIKDLFAELANIPNIDSAKTTAIKDLGTGIYGFRVIKKELVESLRNFNVMLAMTPLVAPNKVQSIQQLGVALQNFKFIKPTSATALEKFFITLKNAKAIPLSISNTVRELGVAVGGFKTIRKSTVDSIERLFRIMATAKPIPANTLGSIKTLKDLLNAMNLNLKGTNTTLGGTSANLGRITTEANYATSYMTKFSQALSVAEIIRASQAYLELGNQLAYIASIAPNLNIDKIKQELMNLSPVLGSTAQNAEALYYAYSSGVRGSEESLVKFTETASKVALLTRAQLRPTVDSLTAAMNAYGVSASNASEVADRFFKIIKYGKASGEQLANAFGQVSPTARALGLDMDELGASIASLTKVQPTRVAITSLNNMLSKIMKPTKSAQTALDKLGVNMSYSAVQTKGFSGVLEELHDALKGNMEALKNIFPDLRGQRAAMYLLGQGWYDFQKQLDIFKNGAPELEDALTNLTNNVDYQLSVIPKTIQKINETVGSLATKLVTLDGALLPVIKAFNNMSERTKKIIASIGLAIAAFGAYKATLLTIISIQTVFIKQQEYMALHGYRVGRGLKGMMLVSFAKSLTNVTHKFTMFNRIVRITTVSLGKNIAAMKAYKSMMALGWKIPKMTLLNTQLSILGNEATLLAANWAKMSAGVSKGILTITKNIAKHVPVAAVFIKGFGAALAGVTSTALAVLPPLVLIGGAIAAIVNIAKYSRGENVLDGFFGNITRGVINLLSWIEKIPQRIIELPAELLTGFVGGVFKLFGVDAVSNFFNDIWKKYDNFKEKIKDSLGWVYALIRPISYIKDQINIADEAEANAKRIEELNLKYREQIAELKGYEEAFKSIFESVDTIFDGLFDEESKQSMDDYFTDLNSNYDEAVKSYKKYQEDVKAGEAELLRLINARSIFGNIVATQINGKDVTYDELIEQAQSKLNALRDSSDRYKENLSNIGNNLKDFFNQWNNFYEETYKEFEGINVDVFMSEIDKLNFKYREFTESADAIGASIDVANVEKIDDAMKKFSSSLKELHKEYTKMIEDDKKVIKELEKGRRDIEEKMIKSDSGLFAYYNKSYQELIQKIKDAMQNGANADEIKDAYSELSATSQKMLEIRKNIAKAEEDANKKTLELIKSMDKYSQTSVDAVDAFSVEALKLESRRFKDTALDVPTLSSASASEREMQTEILDMSKSIQDYLEKDIVKQEKELQKIQSKFDATKDILNKGIEKANGHLRNMENLLGTKEQIINVSF